MTPRASSFSEIKIKARLSFPRRRVGATACVCVHERGAVDNDSTGQLVFSERLS